MMGQVVSGLEAFTTVASTELCTASVDTFTFKMLDCFWCMRRQQAQYLLFVLLRLLGARAGFGWGVGKSALWSETRGERHKCR